MAEQNIIENIVYERTENLIKSIFKTPLEVFSTLIKPLPEGFNFGGEQIKVIRLYECGQLVIVLGLFEANSIYPFHTHGTSAEHLVCVKGKLEVTITQQDLSTGEPYDEIKILEPTGCMTIPVGVQHSVMALEESEVVAICIPPEIAYCKVSNGRV